MGNQPYHGDIEKRKKFYDEREWRFIPDNSPVETFFRVKADEIKHSKKKSVHRMTLDLSMVEYIIIEKEREIESLLKELEKISKNKIQFNILLTKILTARQIEHDF